MPIIVEFLDLDRWHDTVTAKCPKADRMFTVAADGTTVVQVVALDVAATYRCLIGEDLGVQTDDPRVAGAMLADDINVV